MKKIISIVLCMAILFCFSATAFADAPTVSENIPILDDVSAGARRGPEHQLDGCTVTMTHSNVCFRKQPSLSAVILGLLQQGEQVYIIKYNYATVDGVTWAYVKARGLTGFVSNEYL